MKLIRTVFLLALPFYFISCSTQKRLPNYLETITDSTGKGEVKIPELKIQKDDNLFIQISSSATKPEVDELYNMRSTSSGTGAGQGSPISGFLVDINGDIEYPKLGTFHAEGLTKTELSTLIKKRITDSALLTNPVVIVRFLNLKVTVLGEVNTQGVINFPGERVTILEAVGMAGGITEYGLKETVKVMRESNGKREIGFINLSSDKLFESPYYNLMPSDVVIVDPTPRKAKKAEQDVILQRVGFALSVITAIALVYNIFK
jgi:polysaccharide export outer membrane protein